MRPIARLLRSIVLAGFGLAAALALGAQSTPAAWEVRSAAGRVVLLGSIHLGKPAFYPLPKAVEEAFEAAPILAVEADVTEMMATAMKLAPKMMYAAPDNLDKHLTPAGLAQFDKQVKAPGVQATLKKVGLPEAMLRMFRPWALTMTLAAAPALEGGLDPNLGIDLHYLKRAKQAKKTVVELEGVEGQVRMLEEMPEATQEAALLDALDQLASGKTQKDMAALLAAWQKGETATLEGMAAPKDSRPATLEWNRRFLAERNRTMADKVAGLLAKPDPAFVLVGAAHLVGKEGVVELLKQRGFTVKRIS